MTTHPDSRHTLINPGPVDDICQDNAHRAGTSNHLEGSGENPMVGTTQGSAASNLVDQVRAVITNPALRPPRRNYRGDVIGTDYHALAELVAAIVTEHITDLQVCCDASEDAVLDLLHDLEGGAR